MRLEAMKITVINSSNILFTSQLISGKLAYTTVCIGEYYEFSDRTGEISYPQTCESPWFARLYTVLEKGISKYHTKPIISLRCFNTYAPTQQHKSSLMLQPDA